MKKIKLILLITCSLQLLSCESVKKGLGLEKDTPNEFLVEKKKSIVLPPNYDLIIPDLKTEVKKSNSDQDLKSILNNQLNKNTTPSAKNTNITSSPQEKETENKILNMIK